jgi:hypothetical protein
MHDYRTHIFDHNGDFIQSDALRCDNNDASAIEAARKLAGGRRFEIWQLGRRIKISMRDEVESIPDTSKMGGVKLTAAPS